MEFVEGGTLQNILHSDVLLPWSIRLQMVQDIACGIHALHHHDQRV